MAFFFPWATVFGKSTHLSSPRDIQVVSNDELTPEAQYLYQELGVRSPSLRKVVGEGGDESVAHADARKLALFTIIDILVFFAVLLVGFAYVWKRGDLDWVRAVTPQRTQREGDLSARSEAAEELVSSR